MLKKKSEGVIWVGKVHGKMNSLRASEVLITVLREFVFIHARSDFHGKLKM